MSGGRRTLLVATFIAAGMACAVGVLYTFTDAAVFRQRYVVTTNIPDVGGMRKGDPVRMRGVNIGRVMGFEIKEEGVDVRLELESEYPVPRDSEVRLVSAGLIGGMMPSIVPGKSRDAARDGDRLRGGESPAPKTMDIDSLLAAVKPGCCCEQAPTSGATK